MATAIRPKQRDEQKAERDRRNRHTVAARHPGVKQFSAIVRDAILLRRRIVAWLAEADPVGGEQTETTMALAAATGSDLLELDGSQVDGFFRQLYFLECSLENATEVMTSAIYYHAMPECFPAEKATA